MLQNHNIEIYENPGGQYTVMIDDSIFAMNSRANKIQGSVNQYVGELSQSGFSRQNFGKRIGIYEAPDSIIEAIENRIE